MANYSAPMPAIGLYIAGASLVCFLFLLFDIWSGVRSRKPWLPCRSFSLNSLTLSLLAVATKLPVDLTTPMPSALDQLSKLIGTTLICISMGFFLPSLGTMSQSECFSNLAALTIFVATVTVNICIQISTRVIFCFIVEHILILFFMLSILSFCWFWFFCGADKLNDWFSDELKDRLIKGEESTMMDRLVSCRVDYFFKNPQIILCEATTMTGTGSLSVLCIMILCEALLRSLVFKKMSFHEGDSDYKWSMSLVVVSQILTVLLGFMGNLIRWINSSPQGNRGQNWDKVKQSDYLRFSVRNKILAITNTLFVILAWPILSLASASVKMMKGVGIMHRKVDPRDVVAQKQCREDMERWKEVLKTKSPTHLIQLLNGEEISEGGGGNSSSSLGYVSFISFAHLEGDGGLPLTPSLVSSPVRQTPSAEILNGEETSEIPHQYRVSCLSIVFLTQEAANKLEGEVARSLVDAFNEVFEIIYFIDKKLSTSILERDKAKVAKELWTKIWDLNNLRDYASWKPFIQVVHGDDNYFYKEKLVVQRLVVESNNNIQQLFVDMLCSFLAKLPQAIIKDVADNRLGDHEKNIKRAMQYLMKLEKLEDVIQWEFPSETNITNLITRRQQVSSSADVILEVQSVHGVSSEIEEIG